MKRKYWLSYSGIGQLKTLSPVHPCINKDERIPYTRHIVYTPSTYQLSEVFNLCEVPTMHCWFRNGYLCVFMYLTWFYFCHRGTKKPILSKMLFKNIGKSKQFNAYTRNFIKIQLNFTLQSTIEYVI